MKWLLLVHCQRAAVGAPKFNKICKQCAGVCASHIQIGSEIGSLSSVVSGAESDRIAGAAGGARRRREAARQNVVATDETRRDESGSVSPLSSDATRCATPRDETRPEMRQLAGPPGETAGRIACALRANEPIKQ